MGVPVRIMQRHIFWLRGGKVPGLSENKVLLRKPNTKTR
jgi:hypothetical protein